MTDSECIAFLQWALPHLHLRWQGFRKVRAQVCKRISRRLKTVFMMPAEHYSYVSSRLVKEIAELGGSVAGLVPEIVDRPVRLDRVNVAETPALFGGNSLGDERISIP